MAKKFLSELGSSSPIGEITEVLKISPVDSNYKSLENNVILNTNTYPQFAGSETLANKDSLSFEDSEILLENEITFHDITYGYDFAYGSFFRVYTPFNQPINVQTKCVLQKSNDFKTWTDVSDIAANIDSTANMTSNQQLLCAWDGANTYVVAINNGRVATSTDGGVTWTDVQADTGSNIRAQFMQHIDGVFYYVGTGKTRVRYSLDGLTWANVEGVTITAGVAYIVKVTNGVLLQGSTGQYAYWTDPVVAATTGTFSTGASAYNSLSSGLNIYTDGENEVVIGCTSSSTVSHIQRTTDGGATWTSHTIDGVSRRIRAVVKLGSTWYLFDINDSAEANRTVWSTTDFSSFTEITDVEKSARFNNIPDVQTEYVLWARDGNLRNRYVKDGSVYFHARNLIVSTNNFSEFSLYNIHYFPSGPMGVGNIADNTLDGYYYYSIIGSPEVHIVRSTGVPNRDGYEFVGSISLQDVGGNHNATAIKHSNGLWCLWSGVSSSTTSCAYSFNLVDWYLPNSFNYVGNNTGTDMRDFFFADGFVFHTTDTARMWRNASIITSDTISTIAFIETVAPNFLQTNRFFDLGNGSAAITGYYNASPTARFAIVKSGSVDDYTFDGSTSATNTKLVIPQFSSDGVFSAFFVFSSTSTAKYALVDLNGTVLATLTPTSSFEQNLTNYAQYLQNTATLAYGKNTEKVVDLRWTTNSSSASNTTTVYFAEIPSLGSYSDGGTGIAYSNFQKSYDKFSSLTLVSGPYIGTQTPYLSYVPDSVVYSNGIYWGNIDGGWLGVKLIDYDENNEVLLPNIQTGTNTTKYIVKVK